MSANFSIDTDPQQQEAASPHVLVVRSSSRYPLLRPWCVGIALCLGASAVSAFGWFGATIRGTVVEQSSGAPLKGAEVVALFSGHYSGLLHGGYYTCYHVAAARTEANGTFVLHSPAKPWRMDSDGRYWSPYVHVAGYQMAIPNNIAKLQMVAAGGKRLERMRHLMLLTDDVTRCADAKESAKRALPLLESVSAEARSLASTPYENYVLRRIEANVAALAQGTEVRSPSYGYPSVIGALGGGEYGPGPGSESLRRSLAAPQAEPDERSAADDTALMIAAWHGRPDLVTLLLRAGADPNLTGTPQKYTALLKAVGGAITFSGDGARQEDYLKTVELLATASTCPYIRDIHGRSPTDAAEGWGGGGKARAEVVDALVRACLRR